MGRLLAAFLVSVVSGFSQPIEIVNRHGGVRVEVIAPPARLSIEFWRSGDNPGESEGIWVTRSPGRMLVEAGPPAKGESADIEVRILLGLQFRVITEDGDISVTGMAFRADLRSSRGALSINVPLDNTLIQLEMNERPGEVHLEPGRRLRMYPVSISQRMNYWRLDHNVPSRHLAYGLIRAIVHSPAALTIRNWHFPRDWPRRPHTHAKDSIARLQARSERRRDGEPLLPDTRGRADLPPAAPSSGSDDVVFHSEVRMVSMSVAVSDSEGRPLSDLGRADFRVEEEGQQQRIRIADPEESPFNLGILLDLSGSTAVDLDHMRDATLQLIRIARAEDRVAIYCMNGNWFLRLSKLTSDREALLTRAANLPHPTGGSPLWDAIALAYDDELAGRAGERNALVVISDGIDNRISGQSVPSSLPASRLIRAAAEMDARIYPIVLLSGERFGRNWSAKALERMRSLAERSGGRLFTARSVADIEPVLPELAREMRSVYAIAYYPANQEFDGKWRRVRINVNVPGAQVRARPGYFAE